MSLPADFKLPELPEQTTWREMMALFTVQKMHAYASLAAEAAYARGRRDAIRVIAAELALREEYVTKLAGEIK